MASLNLNKVILCGRLTADPELKQTPSGIAVVSFTLAVNRRFQSNSADGTQAQQQADFITVVAWRQTAEFISRYFRKGSALCVTGSIQTRSWQDQQGQKRYATEVVADEAMFVDSKSEAGNHDAPTFASQPPTAPNFENLKTDDDLPF
jgi:single-strand DNA-binding protein